MPVGVKISSGSNLKGTTKDSGDLDWVEHTPVDSGDACVVQDGADLSEGLAFVPQ